jgi:hypothetical protein
MGGAASRGRCGGFQWMTGPVFHVSINLTLKQGLFSPSLKFIEKPFNFCFMKFFVVERGLEGALFEVDEAIQPAFGLWLATPPPRV